MVSIDRERLKLVGKFLKDKETGEPLNFYSYKTPAGVEIIASDEYPPITDDSERVVNFFFGVVMQDFGFWRGNKKGYQEPIYGILNEKQLKGANFLWTRSMQLYRENPDFFASKNLAVLSVRYAKRWFSDDRGKVLFQDFKDRVWLSREYGRTLEIVNRKPIEIVAAANSSTQPLKTFLNYLTAIVPGYKEDPLQKKATLLAMALANRPERFLKVAPDDPYWRPIVDYHLMRLLLRLGIVNAEEYREKLIDRQWVSKEVEESIRKTVYQALLDLLKLSNKKMAELDVLLWMGRKYCPEMTKPECEKCLFNLVCAKDIQLFQPVYRTTYY